MGSGCVQGCAAAGAVQHLCRLGLVVLREAQLESVMITRHLKHRVKAIYGSFVWRNRHFPTPCPNTPPFTPLHVCSPSKVALHLQTDLKDTAHVAAFLTEQTAAVATDLQRQSQVGGFIGTFCRK